MPCRELNAQLNAQLEAFRKNSVELSSTINNGIYLPITNSFGSYQYYYQNEINDILNIKYTKHLNVILHDLDGNTLELNGINIFIKLSKL